MLITIDHDHKYAVDGQRTPGVHEIMAAGGLIDFSGISAEVMAAAQANGKAVHSICELWDRGQLDEGSLDQRGQWYLKSWQKFRADYGINSFLAIEAMVGSSIFGYAGTLDRVFDYKGKIILADIKTGTGKKETVGIQTAAYAQAWKEMWQQKIDDRWVINLDESKPKPERLKDKTDFGIFLAARTIWIWKKNHNKLGEGM